MARYDETHSSAYWRFYGRPVLAYLAAVAAAAAAIVVISVLTGAAAGAHPPDLSLTQMSLKVLEIWAMMTFLAFAATVLPAPVYIMAIRRSGFPRGWSEGLAGTATGGGAVLLVALSVSPAVALGQSLAFIPWPIMPMAMAAGGIGGLTYWYANGSPRAGLQA